MRHFPDWLRKERLPASTQFTSHLLNGSQLHTVCESAHCPNRQECYSRRVATFMILGDVCTRKCGFCAIQTGQPQNVDEMEPHRIAAAAAELGLAHVVVTSVARDDLEDGGADQFYQTILAVRRKLQSATIEVLTPDFKGKPSSILRVLAGKPDIFNHNVETVARLSPFVRSPNARYRRSLDVLRFVKERNPEVITKSGIMLGLGEQTEEVMQTLRDLRGQEVDIVTIGQYLTPAPEKLEVKEFIHPDVFRYFEQAARRMGFREAYCGPYVRSSYHAGELYGKLLKKENDYAHA